MTSPLPESYVTHQQLSRALDFLRKRLTSLIKENRRLTGALKKAVYQHQYYMRTRKQKSYMHDRTMLEALKVLRGLGYERTRQRTIKELAAIGGMPNGQKATPTAQGCSQYATEDCTQASAQG